MIVEKRKRIRKFKPNEVDWIPKANFVEIENWGEIRLPKVTPVPYLLGLGLMTGLFSYMLGSIFI